MRSRAQFGVLLSAVLGLLATLVPAASADTYKMFTFVGAATLSGCSGFGYPVVGGGTFDPGMTVKPAPKPGHSVVNVPPQGTHCNFSLAATSCVKTSGGKKVGPADVCALRASGVVWGYCGYSTGFGAVTIVGAAKGAISSPFKLTSIGGLLTITGGDIQTNVYVQAVAMPATGSCATNTANGFTVAGMGDYKDCTGPTVAGVCDQP